MDSSINISIKQGSTFSAIILIALLLQHCSFFNKTEKIKGAKIYELKDQPGDLIKKWEELNINTAFVSMQVASNSEFRKLARKKGIATYIIFPVFYNPEILDKDSTLYAITHESKPAKESWVEFVCPSREKYQEELIEMAKKIVHNYYPQGVTT